MYIPAAQFAVREQGEAAAVLNMVDTLSGCLARGGCTVVPGLSWDHYYFTLAVSVAGGVIAGAASKLEPSGGRGVGGWGVGFVGLGLVLGLACGCLWAMWRNSCTAG